MDTAEKRALDAASLYPFSILDPNMKIPIYLSINYLESKKLYILQCCSAKEETLKCSKPRQPVKKVCRSKIYILLKLRTVQAFSDRVPGFVLKGLFDKKIHDGMHGQDYQIKVLYSTMKNWVEAFKRGEKFLETRITLNS